MAPEQLRVGLIGFGLWGPHYARILSGTMSSARLAACAEPAATRLAAFDRMYPGARAYADYKRMLRDGDVDAVIVATPTSTHREVVEHCLNSGVNVLVEKPLAGTVADAEALAALQKGTGRVLMVGHTFLFNPAVRAIKGYIDQGLLGDIRYLYFTRTGLGPIRQDVNALWDLAPHDFSMLRYWLGADPIDLVARGQAYLKPGTEDVVFVTLNYPDRVLASVHVSWLDPVKVRSVTVVGDRKMVVFDDTHATEKLRIYDRGADYQPHEGGFAEFIAAVRDGDIVIPRLEQREPLREQLEHFVDCINTGKRPIASADDGVAIVKVLERAQHELRQDAAARAGRGVIHPNVELGEGTVVHDGAIVGEPPRGKQPGEIKTTIGAGGIIRSGTVIYAGAVIGDRFSSGHGAMIREDNVIGDDCSVGTNAVLEPGNRVGSGTRIHSGCFLEHTTLGARVFLGPHVVFTDDPHPMCPRYLDCVLGATVEDDVSIGANATILPGLKIGAGSLIGAGSVVTKDVEAGVVVAGSPAVRIKNVDQLVCFKGYFERPYIWREKEASGQGPVRRP